jgi:hypothetical protein
MVGLLSVQADSFEWNGSTIEGTCTTPGYYYATPKSPATVGKMIKCTSEAEIDDAEAGIYRISGINYLCPTSTTCIIENTTGGSENYIDNGNLNKIGYYKINNKYYICSTDTSGAMISSGKVCDQITPSSSSCGESTIGQLVQISNSSYGLCLAEYLDKKEYPALAFPSEAISGPIPQYFVKHVKKTEENVNTVVFSFDVSTNYYVVNQVYLGGSLGVSGIVFKANGGTTGLECAEAKTGKYITRKEDFCGIGSGKYFECTNGKCTSYEQSKPDIPELNGEKCTYDSENTRYNGNCVTIGSKDTSKPFYLIDESNSIVENTSNNNKIIQINSSGNTQIEHAGVGYFLNADVNTNENYPLILCEADNNCALSTVEAPGYYVNIDDNTPSASSIVCTTTKNCIAYTPCSDVGCITISGSTVNLKGSIDYPMDRNDGVDKQYLLYDVEPSKFPGVTVAGNYAVQMKIAKKESNDKGYGTVTLNELKTTCTDTPDNEIIKHNGNFYYCAGGIEVEMKDSGARFAISINGEYKIIDIMKTAAIEKDSTLVDAYLGYYVDRSSGASGVVHCEKKDADGAEHPSDYMECAAKTVDYVDNYEVFVNKELRFPGSNGSELNAKLIICSNDEGNCKVPEDNGGYHNPYIKEKELMGNRFYINHQNSEKTLIYCSSMTYCFEMSSSSNPELVKGIYINGVEDLALIKCVEDKTTNNDGEEEIKIVCDSMASVEKYGYYVNYRNDTTIRCDLESCILISYDNHKRTFINSDSESDYRIIKCQNGNECKVVEKSQNYYIDSSSNSNALIKCSTSDNTCTKVTGGNRDVYISGDGEDVIICTTNSCNYQNSEATSADVDQTYYLNADSSAEIPLITAVEVKETAVTRKKRDQTYKWSAPEEKPKSNSVFINKNAISEKYGIIYCTSETQCNEIETFDTEYIDIITPKVIYFDGLNNEWKQNINYLTSNSLDSTYIFLVNKLNAEIIKTGGSNSSLVSCKKENNAWSCEYLTSGILNYYVYKYSGDKLITYSNNDFTISSTMDNGYYLNSENIIKCTSDTCAIYLGVESCTPENVGAIISTSNELCVGYDSTATNENDKPKTVSINDNQKYLIDSKKFPGYSNVISNGSILINVSDNKILQVKPNNDEYYLISSDYTIIGAADTEGTVYKCEKASGSNPPICTKQSQTDTKYYPNSDSSSMKNYPNIKCEKIKDEENSTETVTKYKIPCTLSRKSGDEVYCLKANNNNRLSSCIGNCGVNATCYDITNTIGYYLPYQKSNLIECSSNCKNYTVSAGYYASADISKSLILCKKSVDGFRCDYEDDVNDGYFIGEKSSSLVKCKDNVCSKVTINASNLGYYVSGESGNALINCISENNVIKCVADSKPVLGWYLNAAVSGNSSNEKYLIKCVSDNSGKITCKEMEVPNKGFFISAFDSSKLINCEDSSCSSINLYNGYYVNGETNQLIYCINNVCTEENGKGWYKSIYYDNVIYCNNGCKKLDVNNINKNGYYINSDSRSPKYPLLEIRYSNLIYEKSNYYNGWYLNADTNDSNMIIECNSNGIVPICNGKTLGSGTDCSSSNNGKFINDNGEIKWCINEEKVNLVSNGPTVIAKITGRNFIPWISDASGFVIFSVGSKFIIQKKIDGYYYDDKNSELYYCSGSGSGICNKIEKGNITPGYYINYTEKTIIRCGRYDDKLCETFSSGLSCTEYNVAFRSNDIVLCTNGGYVTMENINIENIYALDIKYKSGNPTFPKKSDSKYTRYILADVNKYYVKYNEAIEEVSECPENSNTDEKNDKIVCMTTGTNPKLVQVNNLDKTIGLSSSTIYYVSKNDELKNIEYDADTNNGYFEYKGNDLSNSNILSTVYIKKTDKNKVEFKYVCPIGGICVRKEKAEEPVLGFQFENGILKMQKRNGKSNEVTEKIMPGIYIKYDGTSTNRNEVINCYLTSNGVKCENINKTSSGISYDGKNISADGVTSNKLFSKFVIKKSVNKRDNNNESNVLIIKELTATSYNEAEFTSTTNIFLNGDLKKITNDIIATQDETKVTGYICNNIGECKKIENSGNKKYLLNTAQEGSIINAVVVCGNHGTEGDKCKFINAQEGAIYENYAATGVNDALITCTSSGCKTEPALSSGELPQCEYSSLTRDIVKDEFGSCIRADTQKSLGVNQHCILNGLIYMYDGSVCSTIIRSETIGMKLFDATLRELTISKIVENHYGATLYNCPRSNGGCYVTSGYIASTAQSAAGYSICNSKNGCTYISSSELTNSCSEAGEGGLILDNKYIKLCKNGGRDISTNTAGYYPVNISVNDNFPDSKFGDKLLINVDINNNMAVYSMVLTDGYLLLDINSKILRGEALAISSGNIYPSTTPCTMDKCSLYICESDNRKCEIVAEAEKQYGYYTSTSYSKDLITCTKNASKNLVECKLTRDAIYFVNIIDRNIIDTIIKDSINSASISFSSNDNNKYFSITTGFPGFSDSTASNAVKLSIIAEAKKYSITPLKTDNYVLLNSYENRLAIKTESREIKNIYLCNSSVGKCVKNDVEDGWYISGQSGYEGIRCENGSCVMKETLNKSCSGEGDFIIKENVYQYCVIKNKSITSIKITENVGKILQLTSKDKKLVFPNNKTFTVVYSNSVKGIGYSSSESVDTPNGLTLCTTVNTSGNGNCVKENGNQLLSGEYCLYGTKIYSNVTEASVSKCKQQFTEGVSVEVFYGTKKASATEIENPGTQMFYCKNGECRVTTGYKKISSYYRCDYSKCTKTNGSTGYENGDLKSSKLVTADGEKSFAKDTYFYINGSNNFPGTETYQSFIVEVGADYAVPFIGNGYYLFSSAGAMLTKDPKEEGYVTTAKTGNKLYLCSNTDNNCVLQQNTNNIIENIFYSNAGISDSKKKSIIGCYNTGDKKSNCVIAEDAVIFEETYNKCEFTGKLVRTTSKADSEGKVTYGDYKLCTARNGTPVAIGDAAGKPKYYMLNMKKNDTFAGIDLTGDKVDENYSRNILIEITDNKLSQYEKEGYILYNASANEIIDSVGSTKGVLYYCARSENFKGAGKYSYECKVESNINNGWYFNSLYTQDKRLIKCVDGVCYLSEIKESNKCQYSGSIIYNGGFKICQTTDKLIDISSINNKNTVEIIMNIEMMTEFPGMKTNHTDILLSIMPNKAYQVKLKTNVVVREDNTIVSGVKGDLYECSVDGSCLMNVVPKDNYYIKSNSTGYDVELVKCENRKCIVVKDELGKGKGIKEGFRVGVNKKTPLIQCTQNGIQVEDKKFIQYDISTCVEKEYKEGWYINSGSDSDTKPLIECTKESGCITKKPTKDGWYLNAGANNIYSVMTKNNSTVYPIIRCEGGNCNYYKEELAKECTKGGEVIMPSNGNYKVCKSVGKSLDFSKSNTVELINNEGNFPGSSGNIMVVPSSTNIVIANDGYYYKDTLYECRGSCTAYNTDDKDGKMYYDEISGNLMVGSCNGGICSWTANKIEGNVFLDDRNILVTNQSNSVSKIYECTKNANKILTCIEVLENNSRGYFINNEIKDENGKSQSLIYLCTGNDCQVVDTIPKCTELSYKKNYCYISYYDEPNSEDYVSSEPVINAGEICVSNINTNSQKYYFAIKEINTGTDQINCISMPSDASESYYQVGNVIYSQNKYNVRRINYSYSLINGLDSNSVIKDSTITNEINGILVEDHENFVNCSSGKCEVNKMLSCTYNFQTEKCSISSGNVNAGQICKSAEGNIYFALEKLSSNGGRCVNHSTSWSYSEGSDTVYPNYSNGQNVSNEKYENTYFVVDSKIYMIEYDNDIYALGEGIYIIDEANKRVNIYKEVDISKESKFTMYVCTSAGCKVKNNCASGINYEYMFDRSTGTVISCDPKSNKVKNIYSDGYYLNGPWENLIKCTNGNCVNYDNKIGREGYYLDQGNQEKIIKCIREDEKFKCTLEDAIQCTYNSKEGVCASTVDLLRNSYCLYVVKDKKGVIIGTPKMLYIENYIKAKDIGKCISNEGEDTFYYHYRKSKFLGNNERDEIIQYSRNAISNIYEKEYGYYIISTENRKGLTEDTKLNRSRLYECTSSGCIEIRDPIDERIYVNKASMEKMVRYNGKSKTWEILKRRCKQNKVNTAQCELPASNFKSGDILYMFEDGDINPVFKASKYDLNTKNTLIDDNNDFVDPKKYQYFNTEGKMYVFNKNKQYFDIVDEEGYYMFKTSTYYHNLEPYRSTVNTTNTAALKVYRKSDKWYPMEEFGNTYTEGYYLNKADIEGDGIAIEVMNIPLKSDDIDGESEEEKKIREQNSKVKKFKAVINKCTSTKKNICNPKIEGQSINKGSVCVVTEGDSKGLYLAIDNITKASSAVNCIRYDGENTYHFINNNVIYASQPREKLIIEVQKNKIIPFTSETNMGYYIIEKNEKKLLNSNNAIDANAYNCGWYYDLFTEGEKAGEENPETKRYECNSETIYNRYIRSKNGDVIFGKSTTKWYKESKKGYYFFNDKYLAATITKDEDDKDVPDTITYSNNVSNSGTYLNSALIGNKNIIVENDNGKQTIKTEYKTCVVSGESCRSSVTTNELSNGEVCLGSSKNNLYIVEVIEQDDGTKKRFCYTGSDKLKYRYVNNMLYRLDGLSVQEVSRGYYVLNKNWEEYSSTYPEVPNAIFYCDGRCEKITSVEIDSEVLINEAGTGNNKLLRYFPATGKLVNVYEPGYYLLNSKSGVTKESGANDYNGNMYYLNDNGVLSTIPNSFGYSNIYINKAKTGSLTRFYSEFENSKVSYNVKTGLLEYEGKANDGDEIVLVYIDGLLYKQLPYSFEVVEEGVYAIKDNLPFTETVWTELNSSNNEICYYKNGSCNDAKLNEIMKQKYTINNATKNPSVIEHGENGWRMVNTDGVYFFFEDGYSITTTDRRIDRVFEVLDGQSVEITEDENRLGYYQFNGIMIESNTEKGWEDGVVYIETVEQEDKRKCTSYEFGEIIGNDKFCFNNDLGICLPKTDISNESVNINNCIFSSDGAVYYFLIDDKLYSISGQAMKLIKKSGLYIVNSSKKIYEDKLENKATAYACENGKCEVATSLSTGYYLNMANGAIEEPAILYYDNSSKTWRMTTNNGFYFFNSNGYAVSDNEVVKYAFAISENGNEIDNIINATEVGIYINQSSGDESIIVENKGKWEKAKKIPSCKISSDGVVKSSELMKVGDICLDEKKLVFISGSSNGSKREEEYSYEGVTAVDDEIKYSYDSTNNAIVKLEEGNMVKLNVSGYVIIEKGTSLPIEKLSEANVYKCSSGKCDVVDMQNVEAGTLYVNSISEETPLVKYEGEGQWNIVTEEGYYFFDSDSIAVKENAIVGSAIEITVDGNEQIVQRDISASKELGFYFNKASNNKVLISNDEDFWSKGTSLHTCNIVEVEGGFSCKTLKDTLDVGDYCYDGEKFFLLIGEAAPDTEEINCIAGSNDEPLYVTPDVVKTINSIDVGSKLVRLNDDSIKVVSPGYYILNVNGTLIDNNGEKGEVQMTIYKCDENDCEKEEEMEKNVKFLTESGEIFEIDEEGVLGKVNNEGIYFFNEEGKACSTADDEVSTIIRINNEGLKQKVDLDEMSVGTYINNANNQSVGVYDGKEWTIEESECKYDAEKKSCSSESKNLEVGSYCVVEGNIYVVSEIDIETELTICIPGNDDVPIYYMNDDTLVAIKNKSISVIENDGYYAINIKTREGIKSEIPVQGVFIRCESNGECSSVKPEKNSSYLNKAVVDSNIVKFNEKASLKQIKTIETHCKIDGNSCSADEGELVAGDLCVADSNLYLVKGEGQCVMAEKFVERYQFVSNKIYMLGEDIVVQKFDGYYFINSDNRVIGSVEDYANPDTVAYMCSTKGDCYIVDPVEVRYFKDYTTEVDGKFKVVRFDPSKKTKRQEQGSSGYEAITEGGIYKLDDGSYVECEVENNDDVNCKDIENIGTKETIDGELLTCTKNDDNEVECVQATEGGYYFIGDTLKECSSIDGVKLECTEVKKEGYFLADNKSELYECNKKVEEDEEMVDISRILNDLLGITENNESTEIIEELNGENEEIEIVNKKREGENTEEGDQVEENENDNAENGENDEEQKEEGENEDEEKSIGPVEVTCKVIECTDGATVNSPGENGEELYVCKKIEKPEKEETNDNENDEEKEGEEKEEDIEEEINRWIVNEKCMSGNYIKISDTTVECEDPKDSIKEENIEKPNESHISTERKEPKTTTTKSSTYTTTYTTTTEVEEATTTSSSSPSKSNTTTKKATSAKPRNTTTTKAVETTTTKTTTTTTKPAATTTTATGGTVKMRPIPSMVLYFVLLVFAYLLHH